MSDESRDSVEQISDILPALPGESAVALIGNAVYSWLPDEARGFVERNLSLRKPTYDKAAAMSAVTDQPANSPNMEQVMAKPPLRLPGVAGRAEKAAAAPKSKLNAAKAAVAGVGAAGTAVWGMDELLSFAQEHYPSVYGLVSGMFEEKGVDLQSDDVKNGVGNTRANVLAAFARSGVDAAFVGTVGLSDQEKLGMLKLIAQYESAMVGQVDSTQSARVSTGDVVLDRDVMVLEVARCCEMLGLTGRNRVKDLYMLVRTLNTLTEKHVEAFEQYESVFGRARSRGTM